MEVTAVPAGFKTKAFCRSKKRRNASLVEPEGKFGKAPSATCCDPVVFTVWMLPASQPAPAVEVQYTTSALSIVIVDPDRRLELGFAWPR